ncbi:helix-turn-helix domain-containing protein [Enterococcus cecorum]|uniref:HTH-type transcriptional regulator Rgg C-terminal domain-containing protein n=1 Tax=Enterococcus cecorum TaxID=44008 RepID=A0A366SF89_9ENTE|nr:Rgg/GadR/MutR family transcriptional regulator [Enterococcus cecorum]RBR28912.1 hypothetical protein EB18_01529 [Enterococcus cecorum]
MDNLGKYFKKFRESRNMTLKNISNESLSIAQLSRFENGASDLTITKFFYSLNRINVSLEEFMYAVNNYKMSPLSELLLKINEYSTTRNDKALKKLLNTQQNMTDVYKQLSNILIKICLYDLSHEKLYSEEDIWYLSDYLLSIDDWGMYELLLFSNSMKAMNHQTRMILLKEMNRRTDLYTNIPKYRRIIASMNVNAYIYCIELDEWLDAHYFEKQLELAYFQEAEIYERLVFKYAKNFYKFKKFQDQNALLEMKKCIELFQFVDSENLAENFIEHLNSCL